MSEIPEEAIEAVRHEIWRFDDGQRNELAIVAVLTAALPVLHRRIMASGWQEGFEAGENMAHLWGHIDHWEDYPDNPYVARGGTNG